MQIEQSNNDEDRKELYHGITTSIKYCYPQNELADLFNIGTQTAGQWFKARNLEGLKTSKKGHWLPSGMVRKFLTHRGFTYPKMTIALQMLKGGAAKTTTAYNLAIRLNHYGVRVLVVDMDPQGNLTKSILGNKEFDYVFSDVVQGNVPIKEVIVPVAEGLDILPSNFDNSSLDFYMVTNRANPQTFIHRQLNQVKNNYDIVLIDCNPSLSTLNTSVSCASDMILIPVNPDGYSMDGMDRTLKELDRIKEDYKITVDFKILFSKSDQREVTSNKYLGEYASKFKDKMFGAIIRRTADVATAVMNESTVFQMKNSTAKEDYDLLAQELLGLIDFKNKKVEVK